MQKLRDVKIGVSRVVILCLIVAVFTAGIVYSQSPTQPFTISRGVYPGAYSFTIWVEESNYFAKNQYGVLSYNDVGDCTPVLMACLEALGIAGGEIHFVKGLYEFYTPIEIDENLQNWVISGEGASNYVWDAWGTQGTRLLKRFNGNFFDISGTLEEPNTPFVIKDIQLVGCGSTEFADPPYTGGGLYIKNRGWWELNNVYVTKFEDTLIYIDDCARARMYNVRATETKNGYGVYINGWADAYVQDLEVDVNVQPSGKSALYISSGVDCHFVGGHFEGWIGIECASAITMENAVVPWSRSNNLKVTESGANFIGCKFQHANTNDEYSGVQAAQVYVTAIMASFTNCQIGDAPNADYSYYCTNGGIVTNCILGPNATANATSIINSPYITGDVTCYDSRLISNTFYSPASIIGTGNYLRGNYVLSNYTWIADADP